LLDPRLGGGLAQDISNYMRMLISASLMRTSDGEDVCKPKAMQTENALIAPAYSLTTTKTKTGVGVPHKSGNMGFRLCRV
jgi:hypothetical protein